MKNKYIKSNIFHAFDGWRDGSEGDARVRQQDARASDFRKPEKYRQGICKRTVSDRSHKKQYLGIFFTYTF